MKTRIVDTPAKRIPGQPWHGPLIRDTFVHSANEGTITESVRGNHVRITVRLGRTWAVLLGLAGGVSHDSVEFRNAFASVRRVARWFDCALKLAVCVGILYFAYEIASAFLPGGAVDRVLGGPR